MTEPTGERASDRPVQAPGALNRPARPQAGGRASRPGDVNRRTGAPAGGLDAGAR